MVGRNKPPVEMVSVDRLEIHPDNPRQGDIGAIASSISENGFYGTLVAQKSTRRILAGNHRLQAAIASGIQEVPVYWVDVNDVEARRILLADNRTADLATYDDNILADLLKDMAVMDGGLLGTGYDGDDLDDLLADLDDGFALNDQPEDIEPPENPVTQPGDIILMGSHRLVCGDSFNTDIMDLAIGDNKIGCVLTDPPYGINLDADYSQDGNAGGRKYKQVHGDDKPFDAGPFMSRFQNVKEQFWWGADYYRSTIPDPELDGAWLVWDKRVEENLDSVIGSAFELCWSRQKHKRTILRYSWTNYNSHINEGLERNHPTEKPIAMLIDIIQRWTPNDTHIIDPFAGSGTTLIAAERTGRTCSAIEIDPGYCDVIIQRWETETGETATRVSNSS